MKSEVKRLRLPSTPRQWALWIGAAVVVIALVVFLICRIAGGSAEDAPPTAEEMSRDVVVCDDFSLSNTQLNYYFWSEYYYLIGSYGEYLPENLDPSKPLSEQSYDGETTWEDYILDQALLTVKNTMSMVFEAEKAGFTLPESYQTSLDSVLESLSTGASDAGYTTESGEADVDAYLSASYGPGATADSFLEYLENSYLAAAYSDELYAAPEFTDQEISDYYDLYADDYAADGIARDDTALRNIRVILVKPEDSSDDAWSAAEASAQTLLDTWQAESGTEEDFAALATAHSAGKTAADGGLLSELAPSDLSGDLPAWGFDTARQAGDTAVVQSDEGWNVVYYVGEGTGTVWQKTAEADLRRDTYQNAFRTACDAYDFLVNYAAIRIASPADLSGSAAESFPAAG